MPLILLAEDENSTIDHVRSALASQGWLVKTVGSRDQALRAASEFAPQLVLVNDRMAGADDLVRTFSRRSGGPGVVLLISENGNGAEATPATADVDAILSKPLDTGDLIETIRRGLVDTKGKPAAPPVKETDQVFSSEEIFGDLLDDILDPDTESAAAAATAGPRPDEARVESGPAASETAAEDDRADDGAAAAVTAPPAVEPAISEAPPSIEAPPEELEVVAEEETAASAPAPESAEAPVDAADEEPAEAIATSGLEDLEEVVREGVEAWADSIEPEADGQTEPDPLAEVAVAAEAAEEVTAESDEDLDSKLEDTLAGVLAASLGQPEPQTAVETPEAEESDAVDALLSQALGDLDLGPSVAAMPTADESDSAIDDELEALAAAVHVEPLPEIEPPDISEDLQGLTEPSADETEETPAAMAEATDEIVEESFAMVAEAAEETAETEVAAASTEAEEVPDREAVAEVEEAAETAEPQPEGATTPASEPSGTEFGEYTLEKQIGVGGMASVWKARRKGVEGFEKRVAIKKILPQAAENEDFVEMFIDEAKLAAQLNHSNITHIYDLGKIDDDYFIAMEYVEGRNLRQVLDRSRKEQKPVPVGIALFVASQIADALDYAHRSKDFDDAELGLVHRDVSPQNVLLSYEGDIKLCDFGIAKAVSKISTTQMGALKGKLQYMSPEQAWGKAIDHRSDLFSLGTLLYEMLTGERLFSGDSEMAVLEAVREADVGTQIIQSPAIPAGIKGLLLRALAKDPDDRFESAAELQRGLDELIKEESPSPGAKGLSAYLHELLGMQIELPEPLAEDEESSAPSVAVAEDLEWQPEGPAEEAEAEAEDDETQPWLRKLLTRLLPVLLVVAVGGGILAGLMQRDSPAEAVDPGSETQVGQTLTASTSPPLSPVDAETAAEEQEGESVAPQGQPPPESVQPEPDPAPPAQSPTPEPDPKSTDQSPPAAAAVSPRRESPAVETPPVNDPELERQVEEDLQRVQELMAGGEVERQPTDSDATEPASDAQESFTLDSLWNDVLPAKVDEATGTSEAATIAEPGPGVTEPRVLEFEQPVYTEEARQAGAAGTVRVMVLVDEGGRALEVRLIDGLHAEVGLEEAVIKAARQATYQPATKDGRPVKMWYQLAVLFEP